MEDGWPQLLVFACLARLDPILNLLHPTFLLFVAVVVFQFFSLHMSSGKMTFGELFLVKNCLSHTLEVDAASIHLYIFPNLTNIGKLVAYVGAGHHCCYCITPLLMKHVCGKTWVENPFWPLQHPYGAVQSHRRGLDLWVICGCVCHMAVWYHSSQLEDGADRPYLVAQHAMQGTC